jgi:hypothetical protein
METLTLSDRMTMFKELVRVEDLGLPLPQARRLIARRYDVTEGDVLDLIEEGLARDWPLE